MIRNSLVLAIAAAFASAAAPAPVTFGAQHFDVAKKGGGKKKAPKAPKAPKKVAKAS
jgi:hypothetical protein